VIAGKGVDTIKDGPARDAVVTVGSEEVARAVRILRDEQIGPPPSDLTGDISPEVARVRDLSVAVPRNSTCFTPSVSAALVCSAVRIVARRSGVMLRSSDPALPLVTITYVTSTPCRTSLATVPAAPVSASSG